MANILRIFHKASILPPDPPEQVRFIHSTLTNSFVPKPPISWLGQPTPQNLIPDSITVSLTHAL